MLGWCGEHPPAAACGSVPMFLVVSVPKVGRVITGRALFRVCPAGWIM